MWRRLLTAAWCTCADGFWHPHDATDVPAIHQHVVTEWNVPEAEDTGRRVPKVGFPYVRQCRKDEVWVRIVTIGWRSRDPLQPNQVSAPYAPNRLHGHGGHE